MGVVVFLVLLVPGWYAGAFITGLAGQGIGYMFLAAALSMVLVSVPKAIAQLPPLSPTMAAWWNAALSFYLGGHAGTVWTLGRNTHRPVWLIVLGMTVLLLIDFVLIGRAYRAKLEGV